MFNNVDDNIKNVYGETLKENKRLKKVIEILIKLIEDIRLREDRYGKV